MAGDDVFRILEQWIECMKAEQEDHKLWVDDLGWIKVDGQVIQPFSMGLFLARVLRGSQIKMEQTRVDDGIWMPEHVEVRAAAKIFFVKSLVIDRVLTYSEYRLAEAGVPRQGSSDPDSQGTLRSYRREIRRFVSSVMSCDS